MEAKSFLEEFIVAAPTAGVANRGRELKELYEKRQVLAAFQ